MEIKKIKLCPQRGIRKPPFKIINVSTPNETVERIKEDKRTEITYMKPPDHLLMEWELLEIIISFLGIVFYDSKNKGDYFYFTSPEIKQYYYEITYQKFNKIYGKNGLSTILSYRNGVQYDKNDDMWTIDGYLFISQLRRDYWNDEEQYGIDFNKLFRKNVIV